MTDPTSTPFDDPLAQLRERITATRDAAERLAQQATEAVRAERGGGVPPRGWATPEQRDETRQDLQALLAMLEGLRELVPPELQHQVRDVIRQILLLVRATIDWWVDRIESRPTAVAGPVIEDIPVL